MNGESGEGGAWWRRVQVRMRIKSRCFSKDVKSRASAAKSICSPQTA